MKTALMLIEWQEKLFPAMPERIRSQNLKQVCTIHWYAHAIGMPIFASEQYPRGLGSTLIQIGVNNAFPKLHFSALKDEVFAENFLRNKPDNVILTGMETHICVLQTGLDLLSLGVNVQVPVDAVLSRRKLDWKT